MSARHLVRGWQLWPEAALSVTFLAKRIAAMQPAVQRRIERPQLIVNNLVVFVMTGIAVLLPKTAGSGLVLLLRGFVMPSWVSDTDHPRNSAITRGKP
ncbi:hypothetical protein JJB11_13570 [Ramlibacter ginsenosidimutans]|uniref:Uncharacterized protein n=1 Tax=Ramlibacter ginsenosidimutans TaxID=502333 RepID=A0A934TT79_9BURK|nr:hypothetical protein [Ramlibacter ginsenosidimutans]MBK6007124.1 hypothetical protein [Ramlibacter ginsenosidimutans]